MGGAVTVGVIEDHPLYREALARVLYEAEDVRLGAVADSVGRFAASGQPADSVVVLDLKLRGLADVGAVRQLVGMGYRVLVLSAYAGRDEVLSAIAAGAHGYLTKDADGEEILAAVQDVAAGGSHVSPVLASFVLDAQRAGSRLDLSEREREVLSLVAAGERDQDIAEAMHISVRTVRSYLDRIRDKTGRRRRPELTRLAIEQGIASPGGREA
ncbi:LuxR C-terminal-related transcriptional regulator [Prauserella muralis]|uniref:DNA-binding response regulator n=1 Tax=Prauserella muralis TaxID=588067 RepID=A0A2V4B1L9_9PSEU|nr:response regulator transcription factor [Prauserella muralis]PXY27278.1 DNA-binding response regulator [Prauserella muralis]TWE23053.1 LuxR family two component transcriptional regulator [Prauserella muralis]